MAKVQISIDDELLEKLDVCADEMYMTRSGFISYSVSQIVNSNLVLKAIKDMSITMRVIAESGEIDEESKKQIEEFEHFKNLMTRSEFQK